MCLCRSRLSLDDMNQAECSTAVAVRRLWLESRTISSEIHSVNQVLQGSFCLCIQIQRRRLMMSACEEQKMSSEGKSHSKGLPRYVARVGWHDDIYCPRVEMCLEKTAAWQGKNDFGRYGGGEVSCKYGTGEFIVLKDLKSSTMKEFWFTALS